MLFNLKAHGEFRTTGNGEETVYGIVLDGSSFATIKNAEGQELSVRIDDNSKILPGGSGIVIDTSLPTAQQKAQYRGYYNYGDKVKEGSMTLDSEGNPTASPRFNPTNELIDNLDSNNPKSAANQARYLKDIEGVTASANISTIDGTYVDTQELNVVATNNRKILTDPKYLNRIQRHENSKLLFFKERNGKTYLQMDHLDTKNKRTIAYGHLVTEKERKSGLIYGIKIEDIKTKKQADFILKKDLELAANLVDNLGKSGIINLNKIHPDAYGTLVEMAFNMGSNSKAKGDEKKGLFGFPKFLEAIKEEEYKISTRYSNIAVDCFILLIYSI